VQVEIVYASAAGVTRLAIEVPQGTTLRQAVALSGVLTRYPEIDAGMVASAAVHGERRDPDAPVAEGDRIELCRPLQVDPKEARRRRSR
jgi:putative ubiquitin-RnfH superfamily antitoxin RatB of RatAB toxin-antitoxin module